VDERAERIAQRFELPILVAALLVVPVIVIEESSLGEPWRGIAGVLNWAIWLAFLVELVVMLSVVPNRWRWLREHPLEVIVVGLTPPFLPASLQAARVLRLLRLIRLLRLAQVVLRVFTFDGLRYAALLAFMTAVGGGTAFAAVEKEPDVWDGVWWALTTMTTVGYGDISPETDTGRIIAIFVMVVGIGFGTLLIGAVAQRFVTPMDVDEQDELVGELRRLNERLAELERAVQR
jgi:voltage-gated potassium channel